MFLMLVTPVSRGLRAGLIFIQNVYIVSLYDAMNHPEIQKVFKSGFTVQHIVKL